MVHNPTPVGPRISLTLALFLIERSDEAIQAILVERLIRPQDPGYHPEARAITGIEYFPKSRNAPELHDRPHRPRLRTGPPHLRGRRHAAREPILHHELNQARDD
jgi:hypothetical protein